MEQKNENEIFINKVLIEIENCVDVIIRDADEYRSFGIAHGFYEMFGKAIHPIKHHEVLKKINLLLEKKYRYANATGKDFCWYNLTEEGKKAKKHGGHLKYQLYLSQEEIQENNYKDTERELKYYQKKNAKNTFDDYISVKRQRDILLVISVITILLEIIQLLFWRK